MLIINKRILLGLAMFILSLLSYAQSQYDYYDDDAVAGGAGRALNGIIIIILLVLAFLAFAFIVGGIMKIFYWFNPEADPELRRNLAQDNNPSIKQSNNLSSKDEILPINMECRDFNEFHKCLNKLRKDYEITSIKQEDWENKEVDWGKHVNETHEIWDRGEASYSRDGQKFLVFESNTDEYNVREGVEILCDYAFSGFHGEKKIALPYSLKIIGNFVFWQSHPKKIVIPEGVVKITGNPFIACSVYPECKSPHFCYVDNILYDKDKVRIISVINNIQVAINNLPIDIPSSVKIIGRYSFYEISCGPLIIPNSVLFVGDSAFHSTIIKDIKLGEHIIDIGEKAFAWSYIKRMTMPDSVKTLGKSAFEHCENLSEIKLSSSLAIIEEKVFYFCEDLNEISIPEGIRIIKKEAFSWCKNLRKIHLPNSLERIETEAFMCCGLSEVTLPKQTIVEEGAFMENCKIIRQE